VYNQYMQTPQSKPGKWTEADYQSWPDDERWELIEGVAYAQDQGAGFREAQLLAMSPAPSRRHQQISTRLLLKIGGFLASQPCQIYPAPFDVRLDAASETALCIVQPDLSIICDPNKLDDQGCSGAPDWIIEVLSPASARRDKVQKLSLYEQYGVREYWLVEPADEVLWVFRLQPSGLYARPDTYATEAQVPVGIFAGQLMIDLAQIFAPD